MNTLILLGVTTWLAGAEPPQILAADDSGYGVTYVAAPEPMEAPRPGLFGRLRQMFSHDRGCSMQGIPMQNMPMQGMPMQNMVIPMQQMSEVPTAIPPLPYVEPVVAYGEPPLADEPKAEEVQVAYKLNPRYESRVRHEPDYRRLTGELFYVHADGGYWVVRYKALDQEDRYGGGVVLARDLRMDNYRDGDLVTVEGEILSPRASKFIGGPLYQAHSLQLIDRAPRQ